MNVLGLFTNGFLITAAQKKAVYTGFDMERSHG